MVKSIALLILVLPIIAWAGDGAIALRGIGVDVPHCLNVKSDQLQFACHRFGKGTKFGIAYRKYVPPKRGDDDSFQKLTIVFDRKPDAGQKFILPNKRIFLFFSSGPSSFPGKHGCYGTAKRGQIDVLSASSESIIIRLNVNVDLKSPLGWVGECKGSTIKMRINAKIVGYGYLDMWWGKQNAETDIWRESHPPSSQKSETHQ